MAFTPRTAEEILNDFINYLTINTKLTDFNVGSVIRTLLEVVALEDATQYTQMINILNSFTLAGASGDALNDRAAQYDITRKEPTPSSGTVFFLDTSLEKAFLTQNLTAGVSTSIFVDDASVFPATPFTARLGEGTSGQEDVTINAVNVATNTLTSAAAVLNNHSAAGSFVDSIDNRASLVCLVTGLPDRTIPSGVTLQTSATNLTIAISAYTSTQGIHPNGNFVSNLVPVTTNVFGSSSVIPPKMLNSISGPPPYFGATVINISTITGGVDGESDTDLRARIREHVGALSAGTIAAVLEATLNSGSNEAERITKANVFEDFANRVVYVYVTTGDPDFVGTKDLAITDTLSADINAGDTNLSINNVTDFPEATLTDLQWLVIDPANATGKLKAVKYENLLPTGVLSEFALSSPAIYPIPPGTSLSIPEVLTENTELNKKYYQLRRFPLTDDNLLLHLVTYNNGALTELVDGSTITLLSEGVDYVVNEAVGQIEFLEGKIPLAGRAILATYNVYTGVIQAAQKAIDGDLTSPINFPGVRSAGVKIRVMPALKSVMDFVLDVTYDSQITTIESLQFLCDQAVRSYVAGLPIGGDVILAEIIERVMAIVGVTNVAITSPSGDVSILHDHYAEVGTVTVS